MGTRECDAPTGLYSRLEAGGVVGEHGSTDRRHVDFRPLRPTARGGDERSSRDMACRLGIAGQMSWFGC